MNFGFGPFTDGWMPRRRWRLADRLREVLLDLGHTEPYVEVDA